MIIKGTVYSINTTSLCFISKVSDGIILIFQGVQNPIKIDLKSQEEIDRQYSQLIKEWTKQ